MRLPWFTKELYLVSATLREAEGWQFVCCSLQHTSKQWRIKRAFVTATVNEVAQWAGHIPIQLHITGKGILQRPLRNNTASAEELLASTLPDARLLDFFVEVAQDVLRDQWKVTIARRSAIENLLEDLFLNQVTAGRFYLGNASAFGGGDEEVVYQQLRASLPESLQDMHPQISQMLRCHEQQSSVLRSELVSDALMKHEDQMKAFRSSKKILTVAPCVILAVLVANIFVYHALESRFIANSALVERHRLQLDSIAFLETQLVEQSKYMGGAGVWGSIPAAFYSDQIASSVPGAIQLAEMHIFPLNEDDPARQMQLFRNDTIQLRGNTLESTALNEWLSVLNSMNWVESVEIEEFIQENESESGKFDLLLFVK